MQALRPLESDDIDRVIAIIESHDEEDAEEAEAGFRRIGGREGHFVLEHEGEIIGISGYQDPPGCDRTYWLSWTYVHADHTGQGHGTQMISAMLDKIRDMDGRKVFIKVSDYVDPEDGPIYAAAHHVYQKLGFTAEIKLDDYYDQGENQTVYGKRLIATTEPAVEPEYVPVGFNEVFEIAETDDAYSFGWHEDNDTLFSAEDVSLGLEQVRNDDGRNVFLSFPSNFEGIKETLLEAGFTQSGHLVDYYEDGIDEDHYTYTF